MKLIKAFLANVFMRLLIATFALTVWILFFYPNTRAKFDKNLVAFIDELLGEGESEKILERSGHTWAAGKPTMIFWRLAVFFEILMMAFAALGWVILFKLIGLSGPIWLTTFAFKSVLAVNIVSATFYSLAAALTDDDGSDKLMKE